MFLGFNRIEQREDYMEAGFEYLFIPFGILLPLLIHVSFRKFIGWFFCRDTCLGTIIRLFLR